ncbi:hypothetical protein [Actinoplanes xinjiangensis]|jgi:mRNA-degrading endonuclease YafQ of YafQ-DinJ toxin-antitoxin module|uniref:Sigma-70-like protein n=1 Tax=Actinoplanes xinjiangensis TaxID=512350 RepID=A0A316F6M7_9ACTN|nr:hypothetical protein [Actinoplanes xinjiangensis]PWK40872.1 hypothetical protein BC793_118102 [Actinoplanes xinjiangensis]GIF43386.1 hypothetical protein Axi01nite_76970 [Actinoplanes xinjiangensis]
MEEFTRQVRSGNPFSTEFETPPHHSDVFLVDAVSRGNTAAFIQLFDRTSAVIRTVVETLPLSAVQRDEILAASYLEVWWLAGCHIDPDLDVVEWITGIVRRRVAELRIGGRPLSEPRTAGGSPHGYARLELAALLHRPVDDLVRD